MRLKTIGEWRPRIGGVSQWIVKGKIQGMVFHNPSGSCDATVFIPLSENRPNAEDPSRNNVTEEEAKRWIKTYVAKLLLKHKRNK